MAFVKAKHLEAAQKYLSQGKITQAIAEYEQILKSEPRDQVTLMTIGDLYVRAGDPSRALERFEMLAQVFLGDGFNSKAIAIYKKIAKLAPEATLPLEKLAELYVAQGVMSEARALYLQLAETHLRLNRTEKAVETLRQLLDLEPDNLRVQLRLADLYQHIGQGKEAAHAYLNCAHRMLDHGQFGEAQRYADQALKADPGSQHALMIKARGAAALGQIDTAIELLEKMQGVDEGNDTTQVLLGFYLQNHQTDRALGLARKVFKANPDRYTMMLDLAVQLLDGGEPESALNALSEVREVMLAASDYDRLSSALANAAERLPGRLEALEWLVDCYRRASDSFHLPQALDQYGEALAASGQLERARDIFQELLEKQPDDEDVRRRLNQIRVRLGMEPLGAEEGPAPPAAPVETAALPAAPATSAADDENLDEETHRFVTQALTDVDLFSSYGLTQKAIDLLESAVQRAPRHSSVLEKLLDLHLGAGNDRRTAELAEKLEQIHRARGNQQKADRFSELQKRFDRAARLTPESPAAPPPAAVAEFTITPTAPAEEPAPVMEVEAQPAGEAVVEEVDLSEEWATLSQMTTEPAAAEAEAVPAAPVAEEIPPAAGEEMVLSLEESAPVPEIVEAAAEEVAPAPAPAPAEEGIPAIELVEEAAPAPEPAVEAPPAPEPVPAPLEVETEYVLEAEPVAAAEPQPEPVAEAPALAMSSDTFMSELAAEVDGLSFGEPAPAAAAPAKPTKKKKDESVEQLKEVFDEFRSELGQMEEEEAADLETHYNLGIAYREMGLLEEAIGEFQKVAKSIQSGTSFRYAMQCCTLLGLSFMEKGQHKIAAMWYEKALKTEGLDQESVLALRYDLGVAQESASDFAAALESFTQVYAMNIDYRDVADRIASLQKRR